MSTTSFPETFPIIRTRRLLLREITSDDAPAIFKNFSDPEISQWFFDQPHTNLTQTSRIIDSLISEFNQGQGLTWAIVLLENDLCVGTCGFGDIELGGSAEVGFDLAKTYWGQGFMSETLRATLEYGFSTLNFSKIEAHTYTANTRAKHLLEKLGFQVEKVTHDSHYFFLRVIS